MNQMVNDWDVGEKGFRCAQCGHFESKVLESRPIKQGQRRRRECFKCSHRWTTHEYSAEARLELSKQQKRLLKLTEALNKTLAKINELTSEDE